MYINPNYNVSGPKSKSNNRELNVAIGDVFNNLTIVDILDEWCEDINHEKDGTPHRRRLALVRCLCDHSFKIPIMYLARKGLKCEKCRMKTQCMVQIGETYDKLTVIGFEYEITIGKNGKPRKRKVAVCKCICGNIVNQRPMLLKRINQTNNCGCLPRGSWSGCGKIATTIFNRIKQGAESRHLDFDLTIEYIWELFELQKRKCALSGLDIDFALKVADKKTASLDRIDNTKGYIIGNVQWVHKHLNIMKSNHSEQDFIALCKLVASHRALPNDDKDQFYGFSFSED